MTNVVDEVLPDEDIATFWRDGYLVVRGVLDPDQARHYARLITALVPSDLSIPSHWKAVAGRYKPFEVAGKQSFDSPDFLPLHQNETLYAVMAQLLNHKELRVRDGSIGITLRNDAPGSSDLSQDLHLDAAVPEDRDQFQFSPQELEIGGCYYFTDVEPGGGAIHVVPGGHRLVEAEARAHPRGRQLHDKWRELPPMATVEVPAQAGDFVLMHHLMPHAASHNRRPRARLAQFFRYGRDDQPYQFGDRPGDQPLDQRFSQEQLAVMTPLGRRLLGVDPW